MRNQGRVAGAWYLVLSLCAPLRSFYIPAKLFVAGDAAATAHNLAAHALLFRAGMLADLVAGIVLVMMVLAFHRLLAGVEARLALVMLIFGGVIPATLDFANVGADAAALLVAHGDVTLPAPDALVQLFLRVHHHVVVASELLWGVWLFPLAALLGRARLVPRIIVAWLWLNGVAYVLVSLVALLSPGLEERAFGYAFPALLGELALMLWLLIRGARAPETA